MKIWFLPLEPIEQRYTIEWRQQFEEVTKQEKCDYEFIDGIRIESNLNSKFFLDPVQTNIWKLTQLKSLLEKINQIHDGDIIFFFDLWHPGIEMLPYVFSFLEKNVSIQGYLHAGTYDEYDLTAQYGMGSWGKLLEESWFEFVDKIYVATNFHKKLILSKRKIKNKNKIKVVGFPLDILGIRKKYSMLDKTNDIVFTGRKSKEKGYDFILHLKEKKYPIIISLDVTSTKDNYYKLLARSKYVISPSFQETFGIGIVEGITLGCIPIVPDRLSYPETVGSKYCYQQKDFKNLKEFDTFVSKANSFPINILQENIEKYQYQNVIKKILQEIKNG